MKRPSSFGKSGTVKLSHPWHTYEHGASMISKCLLVFAWRFITEDLSKVCSYLMWKKGLAKKERHSVISPPRHRVWGPSVYRPSKKHSKCGSCQLLVAMLNGCECCEQPGVFRWKFANCCGEFRPIAVSSHYPMEWSWGYPGTARLVQSPRGGLSPVLSWWISHIVTILRHIHRSTAKPSWWNWILFCSPTWQKKTHGTSIHLPRFPLNHHFLMVIYHNFIPMPRVLSGHRMAIARRHGFDGHGQSQRFEDRLKPETPFTTGNLYGQWSPISRNGDVTCCFQFIDYMMT